MLRSTQRGLFLFVFGVAALVWANDRAFAENRVALVIGQSAYTTVPALPNPTSDAKLMADMLAGAGFAVKTALDLSQNDMRSAIGDFAAQVAAKGPDTVALLYYAGHGLQIDGENFLVPIDVKLERESDVPLQAVRLNDVMNTIASVPTKMRIVMLDACRNDPFDSINKIAGHGLAMVDTKANSAGSFVSFSTSPGTEALDGSGANSPYATALVVSAREPGLSIEDAFKKVRLAVNKATDGQQVPWESSSLTSNFFFFPGPGAGTAPRGGPTRSVGDWRQLLQGQAPPAAYDLIIADDSIEGYQAFVELYPQSEFVTRLRAIIDRRREMMAWSAAVLSNTASSYRAYLTSYPYSDLSATARKLLERALNRPQNANAALLPSNPAAGGAPANASPNQTTPATQPLAQPVSLPGPTCPCAQPEAPKRVDAPKAKPPPSPPPVRRADPRGPPRPPPGPPPMRNRDSDEEAAAIGGAIGGAILGGAIGAASSGRGGGMTRDNMDGMHRR